jgi:hypothetical protein
MDNRLKFDATLIDFSVVGTTGQDHDNYPAPGQQPRYDWMRLYLIALLSNQSSEDEPTQYREGTLWYNLSTDQKRLFIYDGTAFVNIADHIKLGDNLKSLSDFFSETVEALASVQPTYVYGGYSAIDNPTRIPIPTVLQTPLTGIVSFVRAFVYLNGALIDPRLYSLSVTCPCQIDLSTTAGEMISAGDKYVVVITRVDVLVDEDVVITPT